MSYWGTLKEYRLISNKKCQKILLIKPFKLDRHDQQNIQILCSTKKINPFTAHQKETQIDVSTSSRIFFPLTTLSTRCAVIEHIEKGFESRWLEFACLLVSVSSVYTQKVQKITLHKHKHGLVIGQANALPKSRDVPQVVHHQHTLYGPGPAGSSRGSV